MSSRVNITEPELQKKSKSYPKKMRNSASRKKNRFDKRLKEQSDRPPRTWTEEAFTEFKNIYLTYLQTVIQSFSKANSKANYVTGKANREAAYTMYKKKT
jgi:hypothetical protein